MEDHTSVRTAKPRKSMKTNETTTMLAKRTPLQTNGERRGVRGGKRIDAISRGRTTQSRTSEAGTRYSRYVNNRKGLVFFVSHFRQPAPSERTRQSGTGRTSPVREISLENAQMRLAKGW